MNRLISEAKAMGNSFFGILGGEPFMHPRDAGNLRPPSATATSRSSPTATSSPTKSPSELREFGNVTPLVSVEGNEIVSDERRGRDGRLSARRWRACRTASKHKVMTGVCTSLCQTNFDLLSEKWLDRLIEMGVMYTWFHIYRPVGPGREAGAVRSRPSSSSQCRKFVVEMRAKKPIVIIDAYYDGEGRALCPAATGFTHHISPWGDIEPCPIMQFAKESIHDERPLREVFQQSAFLRDFRETGRPAHPRLHRPGAARPAGATRRAARGQRHHRPPRRHRRSSTRWKSAPANTTPARKFPKNRWPIASPSTSSSTTTAPTASTSTPPSGSTPARKPRRRSRSWCRSALSRDQTWSRRVAPRHDSAIPDS